MAVIRTQDANQPAVTDSVLHLVPPTYQRSNIITGERFQVAAKCGEAVKQA